MDNVSKLGHSRSFHTPSNSLFCQPVQCEKTLNKEVLESSGIFIDVHLKWSLIFEISWIAILCIDIPLLKACRYILLMASYCSVSVLLDTYHFQQDKSIFLSPISSSSECSPTYGKYLNACLMFLHTGTRLSLEVNAHVTLRCVSNSEVCSQIMKA